METLQKMFDPDRVGSKLLVLALHWLTEDRKIRLALEADGQIGFRKRGAKAESLVPSDSEAFYRKCVLRNSRYLVIHLCLGFAD